METKQLIDATCPECRGPLSQIEHGGMTEYRCLVGHAFSARSLLEAHSDAQEKALWAAVVALEESANLVRAVAADLPPETGKALEQQVEKKLEQAAELRGILERLEPFQLD